MSQAKRSKRRSPIEALRSTHPVDAKIKETPCDPCEKKDTHRGAISLLLTLGKTGFPKPEGRASPLTAEQVTSGF